MSVTWNLDISSLKSTAQAHTGTTALEITSLTQSINNTYPAFTVPSLDFLQDWTIEMFVYPTTAVEQVFSVSAQNGLNANMLMAYSNQIYFFFTAQQSTTNTGASVALNTWNHVGVSYNASTKTAYSAINGSVVSLQVTTGVAIPQLRPINIFWRPDLNGQYTKGYVDNIRVSQVCTYTAGYTVPNPSTWTQTGSVLFLETFEPAEPAITPGSLTLTAQPTFIKAVWTEVEDATAYRVTYSAGSAPATVFAASIKERTATITGLTPGTAYTVNIFATVSGIKALQYSSTATLPALSVSNFTKAAVPFADAASSVYDISRLQSSGSGITKADIVKQLFSTGDQVQVKAALPSGSKTLVRNVVAAVVLPSTSFTVTKNSTAYLAFDAAVSTSQTAQLVLQNASSVPVTYSNTDNSITVNGTKYTAGSSFYLDGQKVTVSSEAA